MKVAKRFIRLFLSIGLTFSSLYATAGCSWDSGIAGAKQLTLNAGTIYVPRDVPVGTTLNKTSTAIGLNFGDTLRCYTTSFYSTTLVGPLAPVQPVDVLDVPANALLQTNVPGIGLAIYMTGFAVGWQTPPDNPSRFIPFTLIRTTANIVTMNQALVRYAIIKTGDIAPGTHSINQLVATGNADMGPIFDLRVTASVTLAGCSLPAAPGNQIEVPLGSWEKRAFAGKDSTTQATPFSITLNSCIAGKNYPNNGANAFFTGNYANIQIDASKTSTVLDAANGILSLSADSDAKGVAIQVLRADGSPMNLGQAVRLNNIVDGITSVPLKARYIQTNDDSTGPQPGTANGNASFTVTYR